MSVIGQVFEALGRLTERKLPGFSPHERQMPTEPQLLESAINDKDETKTVAEMASLLVDFGKPGFDWDRFEATDPETALVLDHLLDGYVYAILPFHIMEAKAVYRVLVANEPRGQLVLPVDHQMDEQSEEAPLGEAWQDVGLALEIDNMVSHDQPLINKLNLETIMKDDGSMIIRCHFDYVTASDPYAFQLIEESGSITKAILAQ